MERNKEIIKRKEKGLEKQEHKEMNNIEKKCIEKYVCQKNDQARMKRGN